jgi:starch phosphorylase
VQGCDVWLNTPRRGMEASGTSGMKAALNGVLNCSVLDGWWDEAYQSDLGWAIGRGEIYANLDAQDEIESHALYELLEKQIVPLFYNRDEQGLPRQWVARMKNCVSKLAPIFNTNRMVQEYAEKLYLPALRRATSLAENKLARSIALAHQKDRLRGAWGRLRVEDVQADTRRPLGVREKLSIAAVIYLADLRPAEVRVQAYTGPLDNDGRIIRGVATDLVHKDDLGGGRHRFAAALGTPSSGRYGFAIRIVPGGDIFEGVTEPGLIFWEQVQQQQQPAPAAPAKQTVKA